MEFGFVGPTYASASAAQGIERSINLYPEISEQGTPKSRLWLRSSPGLEHWVTLPDAPLRAIAELNGTAMAVAGTTLYRIRQDKSYTALGSIAAATAPPSLACNGAQWFITSGGQGYLWDGTTLAAAGPANPGQVVFIDGYFVTFSKETGTFWFSDLYAGGSWSALDFGSTETDPDDLVSLIADHRELWMLGARTIEVYVNWGENANAPFLRVQGGVIEQGCGATDSVAKLDNSLFWLGSDQRGGRILWRADGFKPLRVSSHAAESVWDTYARVSDAFAFAFQMGGHAFYQITFPSAYERVYPTNPGGGATLTRGATWVYDCATQMWHERASWDTKHALWKQHRASCHCWAWDQHLVGDCWSGKIYRMGQDLYDDAGDPLRRTRISPTVSAEGKEIFFHSLQVDMDVGYGLRTGAERDPQAMLQYSNDGGKRWSSEIWASSGKIGEYSRRVLYRRLGHARNRVFSLTISDPIPVSITNAYLDATPGRS